MHPESRVDRADPDFAAAELLQRLRSAAGHLQAVIAMVEAGQPCEPVLHQLGTVQAAIRCAGQALIRRQLEQSAGIILRNSDPASRDLTVRRLSHLYSLLIKIQTYR